MSIELQKIYRQSDPAFIDLLARVRDKNIDNQTLSTLNERYDPQFDPPQSEGYITLTSHNHTARRINDSKLAAIAEREHSYRADIQGDFPEHLYPTDAILKLKTGAQVMFTKNDPSSEKRFVNGTIGTILRLDDDEIEVIPLDTNAVGRDKNAVGKDKKDDAQNSSNEPIVVGQLEWENTKYALDAATNSIVEQREGVFKQFPLRTAWAITIHKSQGLTFDRVIIDAADSFSHGQVYVALSRSRTLEGMVLRTPLGREAFIADTTVEGFARHVEQNQPTERNLDTSRKEYHRQLLLELFDFKELTRAWRTAGRLMSEHLIVLYPSLTSRWLEQGAALLQDVEDVGRKFQIYIMRRDNNLNNSELRAKIASGARYFSEKLPPAQTLLGEAAAVAIDNKETRKRFTEILAQVDKTLRLTSATLRSAHEEFTVKAYLEARGAAIAAAENGKSGKPEKSGKSNEGDSKKRTEGGERKHSTGDTEDVRNAEIFELLRSWRMERATERGVAAYVVATQKVLIGVSNRLPSTIAELQSIKGIGPVFIEKYGAQVLALIRDYALGKIG